ncbi:Aluminum-activated malate transporter 14, partial [Mucuna pruriens]
MESTHAIAITNGEENNIGHHSTKLENKAFQFRLPPIISHVGKNEVHCITITSNLSDKKQMQSGYDTRKMIHCIKVGISLVLVSLLYLLNPLFEQVGENAMWAIMTVVVMFEFSAGATLGKGFNRGLGTIVGGGLGCLAAVLAQTTGIGRVGNSIIIGASLFIFGSVATYLRLVPSIKKRYDYAVMIFLLTFNLVVVSGVRAHVKVWEIARERLLNILMGFIVCVCVSLFVFPLWASNELHDSVVSRFLDLANAIQGCLGECNKIVSEKENQPGASSNICKSVLNSKAKDESLANFAKWEPWHGKFGFSYPWGRYLKIGEGLRELAAFILAVGRCLEASKEPMGYLRQTQGVQLETCEAVEASVACVLRELGASMKQMKKCDAKASISDQLKAAKGDLRLIISTIKMVELDDGQVLAIATLVFLLMEVVGKVEELVKEVEELGDTAPFRTLVTPMSS